MDALPPALVSCAFRGASRGLMLKLQSIPFAAVVLAAQFFSGSASAHIWLNEPISRYPNEVSGENKACPCGVGGSNRTCSDPNDRSDPDRSTDRITTLMPGQQLEVVIDEYVGHSGRYRVAFDPDGADLEDFNQHILLDEPDTMGRQGNVEDGTSIWKFNVTIPDTPCDNCTLQVIQMMDGNMVDKVPDPVGRSSYYQCADIVIADTAIGGDDATSSNLGSDVDDDSSGCNLGHAGVPGASGVAALSTLLLGVLVRRRAAVSRGR
jgi:hypothetical protein